MWIYFSLAGAQQSLVSLAVNMDTILGDPLRGIDRSFRFVVDAAAAAAAGEGRESKVK